MTGKTHVAIGVVAGLTMSVGQSIENQLVIVLASVLGSLAPDLDHPKAKLNQKLLFLKNEFFRTLFYLVLSAGFIYLLLLTKNNIFGLLGIMTFFIGISSHRGFTHSIVGFLVSSSIVKMVAVNCKLPSIYTGFVIGYVLHLVADFFTIKGIKLFYPIKTNISSPIIIRTDSVVENMIFASLSLYSVFLLYNYIRI